MLETFKTAFAAGWGLIVAVLSFVLLMGLTDLSGSVVKKAMARWRRKQ